MKIRLVRDTFTQNSTISTVTVDDKAAGYILEDRDRGLTSAMPLSQLVKVKVHSETAIPTGRYELAISFSDKFGKRLPLLLNVPGFAGIRLHVGNSPSDTKGCLLPGLTKSDDFVGSSKVAFNNLFQEIQDAMRTEKVYLTVERDEAAYQAFTGGMVAEVIA